MTKCYRVSSELSIDYEYDKGPRPSGYAKLKMRIVPKIDKVNGTSLVVADSLLWKVSKKYYDKDADKEVSEFIAKIIEGVQQGAIEALADTLDHPVIDVRVIVDVLVIDPVYSTKRAFLNATKLAIKSLLMDAKQKNLVFLINRA